MKRILYIHQYFSTRSGATGTRSYEFSKKLIASGYSVSVVCGTSELTSLGSDENTGIKNIDGIQVHQVSVNYSNSNGLFSRALKFLKFAAVSSWYALTFKYDIIYTTSTPLTVAVPGILAKIFRRKQFVFEVRDLWPELPVAMGGIRNPFVISALKSLEKTAYRLADHIVALAPGMTAHIQSIAPKTAISLIPNGCDLDLFVPVEPNLKKEFKVVFTGAHGRANGLDAVLDAARLVLNHDSNIQFYFIGTGSEKNRLIEKANSLNLSNCVFQEPVPKSKLVPFLQEASLGLMILDNIPAFYNGTSPNKFFDYISCGLPVLVNYPGWMAELVTKNNCGVSVPPGDSEAFAKAIIELSHSPVKLNEMGRSSRKLAEQSFDRLELGSQLVEVMNRF